ncbi:methyltransferase regulatory domain-containing protein [Rhodopirellula baltica]|nr:methyltransferase regulatory domain-containing protein [Rhodopirellula baltica]
MLLEQEAKQLQNKDDYYLLHEHLEEFNEPVYFHQFAQRASEFGLQYLGEADYGSMSLQNFPTDVAKMLSSLAGDLIEMEQYMDFTRNRMFRQTLLCHQARKLERSISLQNVAEMSIATQARMEGKKNSEPSGGPVVFKTEKAATRTSDPIVRAALQCISDAWPKFVSFQEAYSVARSAVEDGPVIVGHSHETPEAMNLAKNILRCFETGLLELSVCPPKVECSPSEKPITNSLIRHRARVGSEVTNLRHQSIRINDLEQQVLQRLNGVSTLDQIQEEVHRWVVSNGLTVRRNGAVVTDESEVQTAAFNAVAEAMQKICQFCLVAEKEDH